MNVNILNRKFIKQHNSIHSRKAKRYKHRELNAKSQLFGNDPFINKKIGRCTTSKGGRA